MSQPAHRPTNEDVRMLMETSRARSAQRATRILPSAMSEVLSALHDYWNDIEGNDLGERSIKANQDRKAWREWRDRVRLGFALVGPCWVINRFVSDSQQGGA